MKKLTYSELIKEINKHNEENNVRSQFKDPNPLYGVIVYKSENWPDKDYSLDCRSYKIRSDNKRFLSAMGGNSIFGSSLDESDVGVRLDLQYWKIDYCYVLEGGLN